MQGLLFELKGLMDLYQPIYQDTPHIFVDELEDLSLLQFLSYNQCITERFVIWSTIYFS